jgi:hypothetical protein
MTETVWPEVSPQIGLCISAAEYGTYRWHIVSLTRCKGMEKE